MIFVVSSQSIASIISQLMVTTNSVMQLHQKLKNNEDSTTPGNRNKEMLKELENAVMMTQSMLTKITPNRYKKMKNHYFFLILSIYCLFLCSSSETRQNNDLTTKNNENFMEMMDKCSDILQRVQKHVQHSDSS